MNILELTIYTKNSFNQIDFYANTIGLELIEKTKNQAIFKIGQSKLKIIQSNQSQPYHFAINIPCNQETEALTWLKKRVNVLRENQNEIQDFSFWNAKAIYFYDIDNNIVEFIARKNLNNESHEQFSVNSLLSISEIGMPVSDIKATFDTVKTITNMKRFDGEFERFCAIGDENGLFICINKRVKTWFPTGDKAHSSTFEITLNEHGHTYNLRFANEKIMEIPNQS